MRVSELIDLTAIWDLMALDQGGEVITVVQQGKHLTASFEGMHIGATRRAENQLFEDGKRMSVSGDLLRGALALMDPSEELTAKMTEANLILSAGGREVKLRKNVGSTWTPRRPAPDSPVAVFGQEGLRPLLDMLAGVAARTVDRPVLTGINVSLSKENDLVLRATDGHGRACIVTHKAEVTGDFTFTAVAADLMATLALMSTDRVRAVYDSGALLLNDENTAVKLSLLQGEYPSFKQLPRKFNREVTLNRESVEIAAKAAGLLDQNKHVRIIIGSNRRLVMLVRDAERGDFELDLGETDEEELTLMFDAEYLKLLADAAKADVTLQIVDSRNSVMSRGDGWYYWLSPLLTT